MAITVYIPTPYRDLTAGQGHVSADGRTLHELIDDLERRYPGLRERLCDQTGIRSHLNVFINGREMRTLRGEETPLTDGDEVAFIPALVGGGLAPTGSAGKGRFPGGLYLKSSEEMRTSDR
ncbi:MAG TPA: MoaD/ThiS family protein [Chloroflexota bacterium]|nr:MoaD/ThiS family protein [Chloroflexota bacterium]